MEGDSRKIWLRKQGGDQRTVTGDAWTQNNEGANPPPPENAAGDGENDQCPLKLVDTQVDTNVTDLDGKTRNGTEGERLKKAAGAEGMTNEKSPENGGFSMFPRDSGPCEYWGEKWDSNPRPSEPQTECQILQLLKHQNDAESVCRHCAFYWHFCQKSGEMDAVEYSQHLLDTKDITKSWAALPPEIRVALRSIILPYKRA